MEKGAILEKLSSLFIFKLWGNSWSFTILMRGKQNKCLSKRLRKIRLLRPAKKRTPESINLIGPKLFFYVYLASSKHGSFFYEFLYFLNIKASRNHLYDIRSRYNWYKNHRKTKLKLYNYQILSVEYLWWG